MFQRENGVCWYILHSFETVFKSLSICNVSGKVDFQELTAKPRGCDWPDLLSTCGFYSCYHMLPKLQKYPFSSVGLSLTHKLTLVIGLDSKWPNRLGLVPLKLKDKAHYIPNFYFLLMSNNPLTFVLSKGPWIWGLEILAEFGSNPKLCKVANKAFEF